MVEISSAAGAILAGGRSRRFGSNKALASWRKGTILETIARTLMTNLSPVFVVAKDPSLYAALSLPCPIITDLYSDHHALGGIITALEASPTELIFISAADTPRLDPALILYLLRPRRETVSVTVPVWAGEPQPLCALYSRQALPVLRRRAEQKQCKLLDALPELGVEWVWEAELRAAGIGGESFQDVDTPEDYERARESESAFI